MLIPLLLAAALAPQGLRVSPPRPADDTPQVQSVDPVQAMHAAGAALIEPFFERYPHLAWKRRGPAAGSVPLGSYDPDATRAWITALERGDAALDRVRVQDLGEQPLIEHEALRAWVQTEWILATAGSQERRDPVAWVMRPEQLILSLTETEWMPERDRMARTIRVLEGLPAYFARARSTLVHPHHPWKRAAIRRIVDLDLYVLSYLPRAFPSVRDPKAHTRLERAVKRASVSIDEFRKWLIETPSDQSGRRSSMGTSTWTRLMRCALGTDDELFTLKRRLLRDVALYDREIDEEPIQPSPLDRKAREEILAASKMAAGLVVRAKLLENPPLAIPFQVRLIDGASAPRPTTWLVPASKDGYKLFVEGPGNLWPPEVRATRMRSLNREARAVIGLRHGMTGESLFHHHTFQAERRIPRYLWQRAVAEGWGLYTLDWLPRIDWVANPFGKVEGIATEIARARRLEACRMLAALELHAEGLTSGEAAEAFRRRAMIDLESARIEVARAEHDPLYGIGYLGWLELRALEDELASSKPRRAALEQTLAYALGHPHLRPSDMRRMFLARRPR